MQSSETTREAYRGSQLEALYRMIFELQTSAGWQDEHDFVTWYENQGWLHSPIPAANYAGTETTTYAGKANSLSPVLCEEVRKYREAMQAGLWRETSSHPITVTGHGEVADGHHRLTAASGVDWATAPNDPLFEVVFGVSVSLNE